MLYYRFGLNVGIVFGNVFVNRYVMLKIGMCVGCMFWIMFFLCENLFFEWDEKGCNYVKFVGVGVVGIWIVGIISSVFVLEGR